VFNVKHAIHFRLTDLTNVYVQLLHVNLIHTNQCTFSYNDVLAF